MMADFGHGDGRCMKGYDIHFASVGEYPQFVFVDNYASDIASGWLPLVDCHLVSKEG